MKQQLFILAGLAMSMVVQSQDSTIYKLRELMQAYEQTGKFNGSVLVAKNNVILHSAGYGWRNADTKQKNEPGTVFQIASITKPFTSTIILRLVEQKKLSLTDPLEKFYPGFPNGKQITIEHLLLHKSGIHNFTETDTNIVETDEKRMIPYLKNLEPDFAPGEQQRYSNSGYVLLGYIAGKVTGITYWDLLKSKIFHPLQMGSSSFDLKGVSTSLRAVGYDELTDSLTRSASLTDSSVPFAAGGINSSVEDLYKFHLGLQQYKILSRASQAKAYDATNYGYGWQIDSIFGKKMVSHSGSISGFGSNFARIESDNVCIAILSNKSGTTSETINITRKILAILYHQPYTIPVKRTAIFIPEDSLKKYTGKYEIAAIKLEMNLFIHEGTLVVQPKRDGRPGPMSFCFATDALHFFDKRDDDVSIVFDRDTNGLIKGYTLSMRGQSFYAIKTE